MIEAVAAIIPHGSAAVVGATGARSPGAASFAEMIGQGVAVTDAKIAEANRLVAAFAVDDTIPAHRVTFALEEARLSLELMLQVRNRMVEGFQQIMNMQV